MTPDSVLKENVDTPQLTVTWTTGLNTLDVILNTREQTSPKTNLIYSSTTMPLPNRKTSQVRCYWTNPANHGLAIITVSKIWCVKISSKIRFDVANSGNQKHLEKYSIRELRRCRQECYDAQHQHLWCDILKKCKTIQLGHWLCQTAKHQTYLHNTARASHRFSRIQTKWCACRTTHRKLTNCTRVHRRYPPSCHGSTFTAAGGLELFEKLGAYPLPADSTYWFCPANRVLFEKIVRKSMP